jgi:hypothetical protein
MLRLVTAASGAEMSDEPMDDEGDEEGPVAPRPPRRPEPGPPERFDRPEIA